MMPKFCNFLKQRAIAFCSFVIVTLNQYHNYQAKVVGKPWIVENVLSGSSFIVRRGSEAKTVILCGIVDRSSSTLMKQKQLSIPEILILRSLQSGQKRYGMEIRKTIEVCFERSFNYSSLYPKLSLLEANKLIICCDNNENITETKNILNRKYFKITIKGSKVLENWETSFASLAFRK